MKFIHLFQQIQLKLKLYVWLNMTVQLLYSIILFLRTCTYQNQLKLLQPMKLTLLIPYVELMNVYLHNDTTICILRDIIFYLEIDLLTTTQVPYNLINIHNKKESVEAWKFVGNNSKGFSPVNVPN